MATSATVFLEDIPVASGSKKATASENTSKSTPLAVADPNKGKRQRTLFDMQFEAGAAKRQKVEVASRFTAGSTTTTPTSSPPTKATAVTKRRALGTQRLNSIPFSLSAFVESLPTDDARALLALECDTMGKSWLKLLADEIAQPYFLELKRFLYKEGVKGAADPAPPKVYPQPKDIYAWSNTPLGRIKVVILGQDPYPGRGQAHGYSFSVPPGIAIPASLQNIYTEIRTEYPSFTPPRHGHLAGWVSQGVLLLNAVLTVRANDPNSHAEKGWEAFTDRVLRVVDAYGGANLGRTGVEGKSDEPASGFGSGVVVMAWGAKAAKRVSAVGLDKPGSKHLILKSAHPSPRSADNGFFGNGHFKKANEWLEQRYGPGGGVDWSQL
ncbi:Uracil-DNA glycosylase [Mycena sanguinolenta]|uniref:Uracil-DNA glycosylase n=1 Tax=Mycena sanguinolenta TaxID=230812 RepID=A0A8H7DL27_9AGAR|nr:Uracil-DNA glycosylase [Mycena sanguinolenta]